VKPAQAMNEKIWQRLRRAGGMLLRRRDGAQLVEFAVVMPLLVVLLVGITDFGTAWVLKDKLSSAARDGARVAANQPNDVLLGPPPPSVTAVRDIVVNYLTNANLTTCTVGTAASSAGALAWSYSSATTGCSAFLLKIERGFTYTMTSGSNTFTVSNTRVTISYPYNWSFGRIAKLIAPSSNFGDAVTITTSVTMPNLN
jgi:Flp pilus assembly protein TadG